MVGGSGAYGKAGGVIAAEAAAIAFSQGVVSRRVEHQVRERGNAATDGRRRGAAARKSPRSRGHGKCHLIAVVVTHQIVVLVENLEPSRQG